MFGKYFLALVLSLTLAPAALADGPSAPSPSSSGGSPFAKAESMVKKGEYKPALLLFEQVVAKKPNNADAWNYIGFSHRKLGQIEAALRGYKKALAINPEHRGAHEYLGELYVQSGRMDLAREHLAKLDNICTFGCEEYDDLKAAIKAAGG